MFIRVILFSQSFDDLGLTYKAWEQVKIWMIVEIEIWKKTDFAIVVEVLENIDFDENKLKDITRIYSSDVFLNEKQIQLLKFIPKHYFCLAHNAVWLFLPQNLREKIKKNKFIFKDHKNLNYTYDNQKDLNSSQNEVLDKILNSQNNKFFLYWVTGSGKTEIYINLIKKYLQEGKQSLLLVPEIILTNQIYDRIKKVFWNDVLVLNSTVPEAKKTLYFELIHQNKAKVIVWTRSSIFYPYNNLWIIIIDEEHDNSYISDNSPRYDAVEIAQKISDLNNIKLLIWSWTPKVNHFYSALKWDFEVLNLFQEFS